MNHTKFMFGGLLILFFFGRGLSVDEWPAAVPCPGGEGPNHQKTFDWWLYDDSLLKRSESKALIKRSNLTASSHQTLAGASRATNCDDDSHIKSNLCDPEKDNELCALGQSSICVRKETDKLPQFEYTDESELETKFAIHDYHCDKTSKLYYAEAIRRTAKEYTEFPKNLETDIKIVNIENLNFLIARCYFFHDLPDLIQGDDGYYYSVGFKYFQVELTKPILDLLRPLVNVNVNLGV